MRHIATEGDRLKIDEPTDLGDFPKNVTIKATLKYFSLTFRTSSSRTNTRKSHLLLTHFPLNSPSCEPHITQHRKLLLSKFRTSTSRTKTLLYAKSEIVSTSKLPSSTLLLIASYDVKKGVRASIMQF